MCIFKRFILRNWLTKLWGQASWKSIGQASGLETPAGPDTVVLGQNVFFAEKPVLLVRPSTDWMRPTHVIKGHLLHLKSTDCGC